VKKGRYSAGWSLSRYNLPAMPTYRYLPYIKRSDLTRNEDALRQG